MGDIVISVRVRYICDIHDPSDPRGTFEGDMGTAIMSPPPPPDREEMLELIGQQAILWGDANHDGTLN